MCSLQKIFRLAVLAIIFHSNIAGRTNPGRDNVMELIKNVLNRHGDELTNSTQPKHNGSQISDLLVLGDNMPIIGQIISLLNCGSFPLSPNSHLQYSLDFPANNLRLFQTCDRYYQTNKKTESLQVQCKHKNWIFNEIDCERITCPLLTPPLGGHISTNANTYNTTVYFWCSRGFSINGTDKMSCDENGLWNVPPPTCHVSYCRPIPPPRHGSVSSQEEIAVNQTIEFNCLSEYSLMGDAVLRCQDDGRWNTTAPVCKKMCTVPNITSQSEGVRLIPGFKELSIGSLLQQSQRVIFSCKPGYRVFLSGHSTCIGGTWRPPIRCKKTCAAVEIPNGKYILSKDCSTIEYSCLPEYQLIGRQKLTCTPNVTWDSEAPICTKMCTLSKRNEVLSFRHKATYEIIPFGTQIINGTQVYSICRYNATESKTVECLNGKLSPYPCEIARLDGRLLELYYNGNWRRICDSSHNVCSLFGYRIYSNLQQCRDCYKFDVNAYMKKKGFILERKDSSYRNYCTSCMK